MFPNDDICTVQMVQNAAKQLFQKYKGQQDALGKQEIHKLIKDTYKTIEIPYNPHQEDITSFMSVFNNESSQVSLDHIQKLAVKYLCGQQSETSNSNNQKYEQNLSTILSENQVQELIQKSRNIFVTNLQKNKLTISSCQAGKLLSQTYCLLGKQGYEPTKQDIIIWMKLCDKDGNGQIKWKSIEKGIVQSKKQQLK